jgi:hypothetical protein
MLNEVRQQREEVQSEIQRLRERARASNQRSSNSSSNNKAAKQRVEEKEVKRERAGAEDSASGRQKPLLSVSELRVKYAQGKELLKKQKERREGRKVKSKKRQPKFADLGLIPPLLQAVEAKGWQVSAHPSPIAFLCVCGGACAVVRVRWCVCGGACANSSAHSHWAACRFQLTSSSEPSS